MKLIAITGGIGSGKSVVSQILRVMGYRVYDCDSRAKMLMNSSQLIKNQLKDSFGDDIISADGTINRPLLASHIFNDKEALLKVNSIVHPAVASDFQRWAGGIDAEAVFVETAIPFESGIANIVFQIWQVTAPVDVRIDRVMKRNGMTEQQVRERINAQTAELAITINTEVIVNDPAHAVIPQIETLLQNLEI